VFNCTSLVNLLITSSIWKWEEVPGDALAGLYIESPEFCWNRIWGLRRDLGIPTPVSFHSLPPPPQPDAHFFLLLSVFFGVFAFVEPIARRTSPASLSLLLSMSQRTGSQFQNRFEKNQTLLTIISIKLSYAVLILKILTLHFAKIAYKNMRK
jgi:hypothetical protein